MYRDKTKCGEQTGATAVRAPCDERLKKCQRQTSVTEKKKRGRGVLTCKQREINAESAAKNCSSCSWF